MKLSLFTASVVAFVVMSFSQSREAQVVRLPPTAFPELPANLVQELQRRQCTIPQETASESLAPWYAKKPNNVIKGEFARPGQIDWAVLCSVKGISTILVFWNGSENNPAALLPAADSNHSFLLWRSEWSERRWKCRANICFDCAAGDVITLRIAEVVG